jgi:hypothetical protein
MRENIATILASAHAQMRIAKREYERRLDLALDRMIDAEIGRQSVDRRTKGAYRRDWK